MADSNYLRAVYRPMVEAQYPGLIDQYGEDAVWEALAQVGAEQMRRATGLPL